MSDDYDGRVGFDPEIVAIYSEEHECIKCGFFVGLAHDCPMDHPELDPKKRDAILKAIQEVKEIDSTRTERIKAKLAEMGYGGM